MPTSPSPASKPLAEASPSDALALIIGAAESAIGVPYDWAGTSLQTGADCSGLMQRAFAAGGISLPRVSADQMRVGQSVASMEEARPGDLLGYDTGNRNGNGVEHIALYIGNGLMIEAPRPGEQIRVTEVRPGAQVSRVLGVLPATNPGNVPLGPNTDRKFTAAALGLGASLADVQGQPEVVPASSVTAAPAGGFGDDLPDDATPEQTEAYIEEHFPDLAGLMGNDEIRYILTWGVREDKGDAEILGALHQTKYWLEHSAPSRNVDLWLAENGEDSAEVARITDEAKQIVGNLFQRNGTTLDDATLSGLAMQALRAGDISLQGFVVNQAGLNRLVAYGMGQAVGAGEDLPTGETSLSADTILRMARAEYMLPITQREADRWAVDLLNGSQTEESIRATLQQRAGDRYSWANLQSGQTMQSATDGTVAILADLLELDPDTIDLLDPRWSDFLEGADPQTGVRRGRTPGEVAQMARTRAEFRDTQRFNMEKSNNIGRLREWAAVA